MKTSFKIQLLLSIVVCWSCEQNDNTVPLRYLDLKFQSDDEAHVAVIREVLFLNGKLHSPQLDEIEAVHSVSKDKVLAYIRHSSTAKSDRITRILYERTYIFNGSCLEYGTLITDTNTGVQLFFPASLLTKQLGFDDICPDGAWG